MKEYTSTAYREIHKNVHEKENYAHFSKGKQTNRWVERRRFDRGNKEVTR